MKKIAILGVCVILIFVVGNRFSQFLRLREGEAERREETKQAVKRIQKLDLGLEDRFYYNSLDESEREAYQTILDGVRRHRRGITVELSDAEEVNQIFTCVLLDFPEYFWCSGSAKTAAYTGAVKYARITPEYSCSKEEAGKREKKIEEASSEILKGLDKDASDYEKVKFIYESVINSTDYDPEASDNQNIYSVLVGKRSVCAGYAKTMQYLLNQAGVFCTYVVGTTDDGQAHAWNIVKCGGEYYNVDATWGDPVFAHQDDDLKDRNIVYDYLCCSDAVLDRTHRADDSYPYPACTSEKLDYYRLNGMFYKSYNKKEAYRAMKDSIDRKEDETLFKYADEDAYQKACESLIDHGLVEEGARYLCRKYSLDQAKYYYQKDDKMNKITVLWQYNE